MNADGTPGPWPDEFPLVARDRVETGLVVLSRSGTLEGRTTGARRPCRAHGCPGWFVTVRWETGQLLHICSQGWRYDPVTRTVRVTGGGEISARVVSPTPAGTPPWPPERWMPRAALARCTGWRTTTR